MAQIPSNISPAGAQGPAKPSGLSDANVIGFLSLVQIRDKQGQIKLLTQPESRRNAGEVLAQIKSGLATYGFAENDYPKLAIKILQARKNGTINFPEIPAEFLKQAKDEINFSSLPPEMRAKVTHGKIQPKALNVTPEAVAARMTEVKLHPEPPRIEQYKAPVEQYAPVLKVINFFNQRGVLRA